MCGREPGWLRLTSKVNVTVKMSSLLGALQKSGGQVRSVTSQAALIKTSLGVWGKEAELNNRLQMNEAQKKYDEEYQKILFLKSSLHELYKIDPVETRFSKCANNSKIAQR